MQLLLQNLERDERLIALILFIYNTIWLFTIIEVLEYIK